MDTPPDGSPPHACNPTATALVDDSQTHLTLPSERLDRLRYRGEMSSRQEVVNEALDLLEAAIDSQNNGYATCFYKPNGSGGGHITSWVGRPWTKYKIVR